MKIVFFLFLLNLNINLLVSCRYSNSVNQDGNIVFKQWVRDTLSLLKNNNQKKDQKVTLSEDSLHLEIVSSYYLLINKSYTTVNDDLLYAIDLLERNGVRPEDQFSLEFIVRKSYSKSMVKQLVYDFDSEIEKYNIFLRDSIYSYSFMKGNLVNKKSLSASLKN